MSDRKHEPLGSNYRRIWLATCISTLGDGVRNTVLPLYAASLTRDPVAVSLVSLAAGLPWLLFSLLSGALVDRLDRKRLMWRVDAVRAAVMLALAFGVAGNFARIPTLIGVAFVLGTCETLFANASLAILPSIVARDRLEVANSRLFGAEVVSEQFVGPPLGSLLFAAATALPFFLDSVSFVAGSVLVLSMRGGFRAAGNASGVEGRPSIRADIAEGVSWLWRHRLLRTLAIMLGVWNLMGTATMAIFVLYALEVLHLKPAAYGILLTGYALGSLAGSFLARRMGARLGMGTALLVCVIFDSISTAIIGFTSVAVVAGAMMAVEGAAGTTWNILTISLRQAIIPDRLLGRVSSVYRLVGLGTVPIGALIGGLLASAFGLRFPFFAAAVCFAVAGICMVPFINNRTIKDARAAAEPGATG